MSYLFFNELPSSNNFPSCIRIIVFVSYVKNMQNIDIASSSVQFVVAVVLFFLD